MSVYIKRRMTDPATESGVGNNGNGLFRRWSRGVVRNWQRRKMIAVLAALDDRVLRDIGIPRGDIERVVDGFDDRELRMAPLASAAEPVEMEHEAPRRAA